MRPALKYHGGKHFLAKWIISMLPGCDVYVEPFLGGGNVLLRKRPSPIEIAGDLNPDLIGFYRCLKNQTQELIDRLRSIPYCRESFEWACAMDVHLAPLEAAVKFAVKTRMSRGALGKTLAWSDRPRGGQPGDVNAWKTLRDKLPDNARRLQRVELHHGEALDLIVRFDSPDTLFYLDPPYMHCTRSAPNAYRFEMTDEDHIRLLGAILKVQGMVVISGYRTPLYDDVLHTWERHESSMPNHSGQGKQKQSRTEVLWLNPACERFRLAVG
jgi:DNA adenine methylase